MSDFDELLKVLAEGKKHAIESNPGKKALKNLAEDLRRSNPFAQQEQQSVDPTPQRPEVVGEFLLTEDGKFVQGAELNEVIVPQVKPAAEQVPSTVIDRYLRQNATFQQPNPDKVDPSIKAIQDKMKFLEQWVGKIAAHGPGSGEVNLRNLDDVDRSTIQDGYALVYNATKNKFEFVQLRAENAIQDTGEPMGHVNRLESVISFNNGTRTFTIAPVSASFSIYTRGTKRTITTAQSVTIPNTSGLYYIYFDPNGVLQYKTTFFDWPNDCMTAYVYWNAVTQTAPFLADERHGIVLDWQTHEYLHRTRGAAFATGFTISNYTVTGDGSSNSHIQLDLAGGTFFDEDLQVDIVHSNTPLPYTWEQDLQGPARIPIFYHSGSTGLWTLDAPTDFPVKQGAVRAAYNLNTGGTWSTTDLQNNKFGVTIIAATNNLNYPVIGILGQSSYDTLAQAQAVDYNDLNLTGFPVFEIRPLYRLIYSVKDTYTNTPKAALAEVKDLRKDSSIQVV